MPRLQINGKTIAIRTKTGATVADANPPTILAPAETEIIDSGGHNVAVLYWTGVGTVTGTVDIVQWIRDTTNNLWVKVKTYAGILANDWFSVDVYGVSRMFFEISNPTGAVGTEFKLRGFAAARI